MARLSPSGLLQVAPTVGDLGAEVSQLQEVGVSPGARFWVSGSWLVPA